MSDFLGVAVPQLMTAISCVYDKHTSGEVVVLRHG